jgi:hypothetical protein
LNPSKTLQIPPGKLEQKIGKKGEKIDKGTLSVKV